MISNGRVTFALLRSPAHPRAPSRPFPHLFYPILECRDDLRIEFAARRLPTREAVLDGYGLPKAMVGAFEREIHTLPGPRFVDDLGDQRMVGFGSDEVIPSPDGKHVRVPFRPVRRKVPRGELRPETHRATVDPARRRQLRQS